VEKRGSCERGPHLGRRGKRTIRGYGDGARGTEPKRNVGFFEGITTSKKPEGKNTNTEKDAGKGKEVKHGGGAESAEGPERL